MKHEIKVPTVGESIQEVQIGQWLKREGQSIDKDENLVEIESDKATVDLPAPVAGIVAQIAASAKATWCGGHGDRLLGRRPADVNLCAAGGRSHTACRGIAGSRFRRAAAPRRRADATHAACSG